MKINRIIALVALPGLLLLGSCGDKAERIDKKMEKGFRLPDGDEEDGRVAFIQLRCHACHTVAGVELPGAENKPEGIQFELGGTVRKVKTYGQLVTAIIQPQHVVSEKYRATLEKDKQDLKLSPMINSNSTMTVQQLADIVSFLHDHYEKADPAYDNFDHYSHY